MLGQDVAPAHATCAQAAATAPPIASSDRRVVAGEARAMRQQLLDRHARKRRSAGGRARRRNRRARSRSGVVERELAVADQRRHADAGDRLRQAAISAGARGSAMAPRRKIVSPSRRTPAIAVAGSTCAPTSRSAVAVGIGRYATPSAAIGGRRARSRCDAAARCQVWLSRVDRRIALPSLLRAVSPRHRAI